MAQSAPPVDLGGSAQGRTAVDRALESRARLSVRAAETRSATASAGAGATLDAVGRAQSGAASHATATPNGIGLGVGGNAGGHASAASSSVGAGHAGVGLGSVGVGVGGNANGHASPQAGTGRLSRDGRGANGRTVGRGRQTATVAVGASGQTATRSGLRLGWLKRSERAPVLQVSGETTGSARVDGRVAHDAERPQFDLSRADRLLAHRLAQIERMRDRAVEADDDELLRQADRLEVIARAQYSQRTDGETSVGAAVTSFNASQFDSQSEGGVGSSTETDLATDTTTQSGTATGPTIATDAAAGTTVETDAAAGTAIKSGSR